MKNMGSYLLPALVGLAYGLVLILLSRLLITRMSGLFQLAAPLAGRKETEEIVRILSQLKNARIGSPWVSLLLFAGLWAVFFFLIRTCGRKILVSCCVWIPLLLPLTLLVLCFSTVNGIRPASLLLKTAAKSSYQTQTYASQGDSWYFGYGRRQILPPENSGQPLYIAGYNSGVEITGVLDYCEARAVWLDTGSEGVLLIGIDCVALDSGTVARIRENLAGIPNCFSVNVYSTHTHAGPDTLGLWGPTAVNGKNDAYMEALIRAATEAGQEAAAGRKAGKLLFGQAQTQDMYRDSRNPQVYDPNLYQLRFASEDGAPGLRLLFYGAHAESLRGANTMLSRDFPGLLCDDVTAATGDAALFLPGAIGGLIMTKEFISADADAVGNLRITADKLVDYALSIDTERELQPELAWGRRNFLVPMDNVGFLLFKALGILNNNAVPTVSATGYGVETELSVLLLDGLAVTLLPGEIFPELVYGGAYGFANPSGINPDPLILIAQQHGVEQLLTVGLSNDEIGYIVPPSDFLVHKEQPYLKRIVDYFGEDHYEETNSIGPECARMIAETFEAVLDDLKTG